MNVEVTFPRRRAMLSIKEPHYDGGFEIQHEEVARVPVFVWPMPDVDGRFVVELESGECRKAWPHELTFLDSKEMFELYDWSEHD